MWRAAACEREKKVVRERRVRAKHGSENMGYESERALRGAKRTTNGK
jgi:hypothetical protein